MLLDVNSIRGKQPTYLLGGWKLIYYLLTLIEKASADYVQIEEQNAQMKFVWELYGQ